MKQLYFYASILSTGLLAFTSGSYAALDCNQFVYSTSTLQACNMLKQTVSEARKEDEARFQKVQSQKQMVQQNGAPALTNPALQNMPSTQTQPSKQIFSQPDTNTSPPQNGIGSVPSVSTPEITDTTIESQPQNSTPSTDQKTNRIKYY